METLELIEKIRGGRQVKECQDALYRRVEGALLHRIAQRISPCVRSRFDPGDVLNNAFLRCMGSLGLRDFPTEAHFFAYVHRIAIHLICDEEGKGSVRGREPPRPGEAPSLLEQTRAPGPGPMTEAVSRERKEQLRRLLKLLPPKDAEVIRLCDLDQLSLQEIARRQNKTYGAVQRQYSRAKKKLDLLAKKHASWFDGCQSR